MENSGEERWGGISDTFHPNLAGQLDEFVVVKNRYIKAPFPAWTALGVSSLYEPNGLVEIKTVARAPE
ncbi:hypothetical protein [Allopontixanthobacter sp.]|uniref:hypothetical protein n=1 Tax=Allopontixanthobacter sp. TaxID=2906452 RepID=UPI002AB9A3ED|nr:hypothetical protein [Allopontixanthobacter sp.]MDZ4306465.1 hypothetical protein [Allopontixanthobacter sp.]